VRRLHPRDGRSAALRAALATAILTLAAIVAGISPAAAAPPIPFSLSTGSLVLPTTHIGATTTNSITISTNQKKVVMEQGVIGPGTPFADSCPSPTHGYPGALGLAIPARTSCTVQISYTPTLAGPYTATMNFYACKRSHPDPIGGFIVCDFRDANLPLQLSGAVDTPDLVITSLTLGDGATPYGYQVTIKNQGAYVADLSNVSILGFYSPDSTTYDGSTQNAACGSTFASGESLAVNDTRSVTIGCSSAPGGLDHYLGVKVDAGSSVIEGNETNNITHVALS